MSTINIITTINAPIERCFDLATSIDLHKTSARNSQEEAIAGITSGLIKLNETVTWRAKHFGIWHKMKVKITEYEKPNYFIDEMVQGTFKFMKHNHAFRTENNYTLMTDTFEFASPLGPIGRLVDLLILKRYMTSFLKERNGVIKDFAESEKWRAVLLES